MHDPTDYMSLYNTYIKHCSTTIKINPYSIINLYYCKSHELYIVYNYIYLLYNVKTCLKYCSFISDIMIAVEIVTSIVTSYVYMACRTTSNQDQNEIKGLKC